MAARQDQGLQIGLIASIFLFIVAFVFAYVYWKSYTDSEQRVAQLTSDLSGQGEAANTMQSRAETLQTRVGFSATDNFPDVEQAIEADMELYGAGLSEDRHSYREVLKATYEEWQNSARREAAAKDTIQDLTNRLQAVETEAEKQIAQYREARNKAQADLAAVQAQASRDRTDLETKQAELLEQLAQQRATFDTQLAERQTRIGELDSELGRAKRALENLIEERAQTTESFEVADGRISWVNQSQNGTVWINLGEADALRRQVTFSVFDGDQHDAARAVKKGSIEVTRILDDHMAEARITSDDARNPIMPGDLIYSQVWSRGKQLRFGLTGVIDITGDGNSDMQLARELIELNGGVVDAYLAEDGTVHGQMSVGTRYLVLGDFPESAVNVAMQDGWNRMNEEAAVNGVETITLREFLNQMGYRPQDRTVRLDGGASASDFPARSNDGVNSTPNPFRPRTPYNRSHPSATPY